VATGAELSWAAEAMQDQVCTEGQVDIHNVRGVSRSMLRWDDLMIALEEILSPVGTLGDTPDANTPRAQFRTSSR
jgi:hypothetical protein